MPTNWYMYLVSALIPLIVGAIWYGPLFKNAWMKVNNFTDQDLESANMGIIFGITYIFGILLSLFLGGAVIHQSGVAQTMLPDMWEAGSEAQKQFSSLMNQYGDRYRSFGHGALHGGMIGLIVGLPLIGMNALFERRGWKYIWIHVGFWIVTMTLMGGLLCKTLVYAPVG